MDDLLVETLDATGFTMTTVFLMLFLTGLMVEMGVFQRMLYLVPFHRKLTRFSKGITVL